MKILGIDEAGRGPVIGPMVLAGVLIDENRLNKLKILGLKDSKQYSAGQREELYKKIVTIVDGYELLIVSPSEIDTSLNDPNHNLNWLEADKMIELWEKFRPGKLIADCPSINIEKFTEYVRNRVNQKTILVLEHKADENYPVVSAASILAKVTRDKSIETLRGIYGDFGSGYLTDAKTQKFLNTKHNLPIFRKSWISWKRVDKDKNQKKLGEFS